MYHTGMDYYSWLDTKNTQLLFQHMAAVLVRLGQADMRCEALRMKAAEEKDLRKKKDLIDAAALAMQQLEVIAGQAIELGRAMATTSEKTPDLPKEMPSIVQGNPASEYEGGRVIQDNPPEINVGTGVPRGSA